MLCRRGNVWRPQEQIYALQEREWVAHPPPSQF